MNKVLLHEDTAARCEVYNEAAMQLKRLGHIAELSPELLRDIMDGSPDRLAEARRNEIRMKHAPHISSFGDANRAQREIAAAGKEVEDIFGYVQARLRNPEVARYIHFTPEQVRPFITVNAQGEATPTEQAKEQ